MQTQSFPDCIERPGQENVYGSSGLYELHIQINSYFVTNENATSFERCIPGQPEVFTVDLCGGRDGYPCATPGILRRRSRSFYIERHLSRDTVKRQVSLDGKFSVLNLFDNRGFERKKLVLFHIEEVRAFQVCIALSITRFERSRLDRDLDARIGHIGFITSQHARDFREVPLYVSDHHVLDLELSYRVRRVNVPDSILFRHCRLSFPKC